MAQSDARFGYRAKLGRTDFDLSHKNLFTACPGHLLPIFADIATPGDSYYIKHDLTFLRTAPLAAPAQIDVKVHFESFFVPFQMIYQPSENTIFSLNNIQSSNFNPNSLRNNNFPLMDLADYSTSLTTGSYATSRHRHDAFRLFDMLNLNPWNVSLYAHLGNTYAFAPNIFPWQLLAYHTIFNYYYRLDDKTQFDNTICNWDTYYGSLSAQGLSSAGADLVLLHDRPWKFDYFTSMYRSPIVSDANLQNILPSGSYSHLVSNHTVPINGSGVVSVSNSDDNSFTSIFNASYSPQNLRVNLSTASIRQMLANEKLAMITGRTKKNYDSQVLAHFGIDVPHDVKHDITLIGQDSYPLRIGEVTSLATTEQGPLGELAGKGWATSPDDVKQHKFVAPCHGIVMTIFSIEPEQRYIAGFADYNSVTTAFDLPVPEFDRLGNLPMHRYELGHIRSSDNFSDIVGWKERYYYWKRRFDKGSMAFMAPAQSSNFYVTNNFASYGIVNIPFANNAQRQPNVPRPDLESSFYINPNAMDNLMLVQYINGWVVSETEGEENWNATPWLAYSRDPFIVDTWLKVKKVSWMSKDGEPIYD